MQGESGRCRGRRPPSAPSTPAAMPAGSPRGGRRLRSCALRPRLRRSPPRAGPRRGGRARRLRHPAKPESGSPATTALRRLRGRAPRRPPRRPRGTAGRPPPRARRPAPEPGRAHQHHRRRLPLGSAARQRPSRSRTDPQQGAATPRHRPRSGHRAWCAAGRRRSRAPAAPPRPCRRAPERARAFRSRQAIVQSRPRQ